MREFMDGVKAEMKKISWPTKEKLVKDTRVSFIMAIVLALGICFVNNGFSYIVNLILNLF